MTEETNINAPEVKGSLFSVGQMILATVIGMPIAGCLLLAANYRQLGESAAAWQSVAAGFVSTILLLIVSFQLPENFPNMALPIAYCLFMRQLIIHLQGGAIDNHLKSGGSKGSWAIAVVAGVVCLMVILAVVFGVVMMFDVQ